MSQTVYGIADIGLLSRRLFGGRILRDTFLYSELPDRRDGVLEGIAAKNSLAEGYLDFILLFRDDSPGKISERSSFINKIEAIYCPDSIENMELVKYTRGEDNITKFIGEMLNRKNIHRIDEGDIMPFTVLGDDIGIPVYVLVPQSFASLG